MESAIGSVKSRVQMFEAGALIPEKNDTLSGGEMPTSPKRRVLELNGKVSRRYNELKALRNHPSSSPKQLTEDKSKPSKVAGGPSRAFHFGAPDGTAQLSTKQNIVDKNEKVAWPTSPAQKVWSQSQLNCQPTDNALERKVGVEDGAGWFSPTQSEESDQLGDSNIPSSTSPRRAHSPPTESAKSVLVAHSRSERTKAAAARTETPNKELKMNLRAASVVMQVEKQSSVGSGSSSTKSSLSDQELRNVAQRALQLSNVKIATRVERLRDSPLHQMLKEKRARKYSNPSPPLPKHNGQDEKRKIVSPSPALHAFQAAYNASTATTASETSSNSSSQRLMTRLSRAERYAALKRKTEPKASEDDASSTSSVSGSHVVHPVFGYSATTSKTEKAGAEESTFESDSPCTVTSSEDTMQVRYIPPVARKQIRSSSPTVTVNNVRTHSYLPAPSKRMSPSGLSSGVKAEYSASAGIGNPRNSIARAKALKQAAMRWENSTTSKSSSNDCVPNSSAETLSSETHSYETSHSQETSEPSSQSHDEGVASNDSSQSSSTDEGGEDQFSGAWDFDSSSSSSSNTQQKIVGVASTRIQRVQALAETFKFDSDSSVDEPIFRESARTSLLSTRIQKAVIPTESPDIKRSVGRSGNSSNPIMEKYLPELSLARSRSSEVDNNSMLLGEGITQISSVDTSTFNSSLTGSAFQSLTSKSQEKSASTKPSTSGSEAQRQRALEGNNDTLTYTSSSGAEHHSSGKSKSTSSGSKGNALKWWQKNYGNNVPGDTDKIVRKALSSKQRESSAMRKFKVGKHDPTKKVEDDDDIFDGLEEEVAREDEAEHEFSESSKDDEGIPVPPSERQLEPEVRSQVPVNRQNLEPLKPVQVQKSEPNNGSTKKGRQRKGQVDRNIQAKMEDSVHAISVPSPVAEGEDRAYAEKLMTILKSDSIEENQENRSTAAEDESQIDDSTMLNTIEYSPTESMKGNRQPPSSIFVAFGYALADSFHNACRLPGHKLTASSSGDCGDKLKNMCKVGEGNDREHQDDLDSNAMFEDNSVSTSAFLNNMNSNEQRVWDEWSVRDKNETVPPPLQHQNSLSDTDESSPGIEERPVNHEDRRTNAQKELFAHVNKAVALFGGVGKGVDPSTSAERAMQLTPLNPCVPELNEEEPMLTPVTPKSINLTLSFDQKVLVGRFSSILKNDGVAVLKLGRRNRWQPRYLTVSKETVWISTILDAYGDAGQCPAALLWLKRFNNHLHSCTRLKGEGRGGLLFSNLVKVEPIDKVPITAPAIPRRQRLKFSAFSAARLDYKYDDKNGMKVERNLILSFKSREDVTAFCAAINIIKDVIQREEEIEA